MDKSDASLIWIKRLLAGTLVRQSSQSLDDPGEPAPNRLGSSGGPSYVRMLNRLLYLKK